VSQLTKRRNPILRTLAVRRGPVSSAAVSVGYSGRRSGRRFSIPVAYRRTGDEVTISVNMPEAKTWWRNFLGAGGPLTLRLDSMERTGHAVAKCDEKGRVTVTVRLTN
jgi:hypothetical protein